MKHCSQEGDYTKKEKRAKKKTETFTGVYWCLVTFVYLGWSLWTKQWDITYMIWPVLRRLICKIVWNCKNGHEIR